VLNWRIRIIGSAPEFYPKTALWCVCVCVQAVCSVLVMAVELGLLLVVDLESASSRESITGSLYIGGIGKLKR
jgi:hypothetical protein